MTYVITEPCIDVKDAACVDVCPMDCIHPRKDEPVYRNSPQLYIDPEECTDCGACEPECPVGAIYHEDDVPQEYEEYIARNRQAFE
jgi:NAD-dependent dihydropyrimidine dehydrogenase PreA subunit